MIPHLVITGAPASGKTEIFERLRKQPRLKEFAFLDELARRLLSENPDYRRNWTDFHREIYRRQVAREAAAAGRSFITDRGTVDTFAFHPEIMGDIGTTLEEEYARYSAVIHLGSAAALGEEYYRDDPVRTETPAQALEIEAAIRRVWHGHPAYHFVRAHVDFERKCAACLKLVHELVAA